MTRMKISSILHPEFGSGNILYSAIQSLGYITSIQTTLRMHKFYFPHSFSLSLWSCIFTSDQVRPTISLKR